jgi:hypothetical protein
MFEFLNSGKLEKVKINGYEDINKGGEVKTFEHLLIQTSSLLTTVQILIIPPRQGKQGTAGNFISSNPLELSLKFYLDGTKATGKLKSKDGDEITVAEKIVEFYDACGYNTNRHRPRYVEIIWGKLHLLRFDPECFHGCLKTVSINYKLFNQDGTPLRAVSQCHIC